MTETDLERAVEKLKEREQQLLKEKSESEAAFGHQRAKFMELFKQKEDELTFVKEANQVLEVKNAELQKEVKDLMTRVDEMNSESTVMVVRKEDEIARLEQRHNEETASFQHILKESVDQAFEKASDKYEEERSQWLMMEQELHDLKAKISAESESSTFSNLARSLQKRINLLKKEEEPESHDNTMVKAQEDIELLRSVVSPLEEEVQHLKHELHIKTEELSSYIKQNKDVQLDQSVDVKKTKELSQSMQSERASRTDLEMYVTVLNIQKDVLHNDNNNVKIALNKTECQLERERLKGALLQERIQGQQEAADTREQLFAMDDATVIGLLNQQQLHQYSEYKETDEERKRLRSLLEGMEETKTQWADRLQEIKDQVPSTSSSTSASTDILEDSSQQQELSTNTQQQPTQHPQQSQQQPQQESEQQSEQQRTLSKQAEQPRISEAFPTSRHSPSKQHHHQVPQHSKEQQSTPDSTLDWQKIQNEVEVARGKLGRQCVRCEELQGELKEEAKQWQGKVDTMTRLLDQERQAIGKKEAYIRELETNLQIVMENSDAQISTLHSKLLESEKFMRSFREQFEKGKMELFDYLKNLGVDRQTIQKELNRLQSENDSLVEKHARKAQEMQEEVINLPNNLEDMQLMLLKYREDLITCRVSLEHARETMGGEVAFLKSRLEAEQQERVVMEDTLTQELSQLQNQLDVQRHLAQELEKERRRRSDEEAKRMLAEEEARKKEKAIGAHQFENKQLNSVKAKLEKTVMELRSKVHGLQVDLDNSEYVQRDFVKLSQTLQIQLEKIRAGESEVRWQHEDDVHQCPTCKTHFTTPGNKYHCRHCGHIFCQACLCKSVPSGPSLRPSRVCDVCHTMLVKSATPFFSQDSSSHQRNHLANHSAS